MVTVLLQAFPVLHVLFPGNVWFVMLRQANGPGWHSGYLHTLPGLALRVDFQTILITSKDIRPGVRRILEYVLHPFVVQLTPDQLAVPGSPMDSLRKA